MTIEEYFMNLYTKKDAMNTAYKDYLDSIYLFSELTGISYKEIMTSSSRKIKGLDDGLVDSESKNEKYLKARKEYEIEREKCLDTIKSLSKPLHRLIIQYGYMNQESNKDIATSLRKYHKQDYSEDYIRNKKVEAKREFERIINEQFNNV